MQQVNLYLPELRPQRDWLSANHAGLLAMALLGLLFVVQVILAVQEDSLAAQVEQQQAVVADIETRVKKLQASATGANSQSLDAVVTQLEAAIANREKVGRVLSGQSVGNAHGFHQSMLALARQSDSDLALQRFTFSRGGNYVEMRGATRSAQAVPLYLQRLKSEQAFQQARFGLLSVAEQPDSNALLFSLGYDNVYRRGKAESTAEGRK